MFPRLKLVFGTNQSQVVNALGGVASFRQNQNNLYYPNSKYYNIRSAVHNTTTSY